MAEAENAEVKLKQTILRVRTPVLLGAQSIEEIWVENISDSLEITNSSDAAAVDYLHEIIRKTVKIFCKCGFQRDIANYFDTQPPFQLEKSLVSGSWSEGLHVIFESSAKIPPPDVDFMCVLKNVKFTESDQIEGNLILRDDTLFLNAYITDEERAELWKDFLHEPSPSKFRLSSLKIKEKLYQNYLNVGSFFQSHFLEGSQHIQSQPESAAFTLDNDEPQRSAPIVYTDCIQSVFDSLFKSRQNTYDEIKKKIMKVIFEYYHSCDIVLALSCAGWPLSANEWITRERMWPDKDLIKRIAQSGFHIVPKISREGDFRLSFSSAETTLVRHWSRFQHKVVKAFKAVVKYYQNAWSSNMNKIIKSYHLKTIAFWYIEKRPQNSFTEENVATHLVLLLQELAEALRKQDLPMYFMPKVNLLKDVENYEEVIDMAEKIFNLSTNISAIEDVVARIAKPDLNAALEDMYFKYLKWKSFKETVNSADVENRLSTDLRQNDSEEINLDGYQFYISRNALNILLTCL